MNNMNLEERRNEVVRLYTQEQKSINQIAKELNKSWDTIKRDLMARNVEIVSVRNQYISTSTGNGVSKDLFKKIDNSDAAYWLGFLYADGSIRTNGNEITLDLQEKDRQTVEDFHSYCNNKNSIREHKIKRNNKVYLSYSSGFSNKEVKDNLIALGCVPKKSLVLTFPSEEQVPQKYIYDFVRGYVDGDGYVQYDFEKHRYRIVILGTEKFLRGLIERLNLFEYYFIAQDKNSQIYSLTISKKENVLNFLTKLYEDSKYHLQRKFNIYKQAKLGAQ